MSQSDLSVTNSTQRAAGEDVTTGNQRGYSALRESERTHLSPAFPQGTLKAFTGVHYGRGYREMSLPNRPVFAPVYF